MSAFTEFIAAGVDNGFAGFVDSDGNLTGSTPTAPAAGDQTGSPMFRVKGLQSVEGGVPDDELVSVEGDNGSLGGFLFEAVDATTFDISKGLFDQVIQGKFQGTNTVNVKGSLTVGLVRPKPREYPDFAWVLQSDAKKKGGAAEGKSGWTGYFVPVTNVSPRYRQGFQSRAAAADRLRVVCNSSNKTPYGTTLRADVEGAEYMDAIDFTSDYPRTIHRHTGNAVQTTFWLTYKPVSVAETLVVVDGYAVTVNSVSTTAPYSFTLASAPANNAVILTNYSFQR